MRTQTISIVPAFPNPSIDTIRELETLSLREYPYLWNWIDELYKLKDKLEINK